MIIDSLNSIVVLTGAGVSAESGLRTFRDNDGLWEDHRVEEVATPEAFARDPELVHRFYNMRREQLMDPELQPNKAHRALAEFSEQWDGAFNIVTQNVDNLHERAGSKNVIHMHGELLQKRCKSSGVVSTCETTIDLNDVCECCGIPGNLRPNIVWFGEMPLHMEFIETLLSKCDLFISIGTSGTVYPAAGFKETARLYGAKTVELNLEPSATASSFDEAHYGPASEIVPEFLSSL